MLLLCLFLAPLASAQPAHEDLPAIYKEASPAEVLDFDPIRPAETSRTGMGSGSIHRQIQNQLGLSATERGLPGNVEQTRGLGRSAEDVDVQAFGVSLNPASGGGFDQSIFPSFLWSGFSYQSGPSAGALDPRAVSGSLALTPWTLRAMGDASSNWRATAFHSSEDLTQISAAASQEGRFAFVVGQSTGKMKGPSGAFSGRWDSPQASFKFHLLATDVDAAIPGPHDSTPDARQKTTRYIPILQADVPLAGANLFKSSVFFDRGNIRFNEPKSGFSSRDVSLQIGVENALLWESWKFGLSARRVSLENSLFTAPEETQAKFSAAQTIESGPWLFEPGVHGLEVSGFGFVPGASFGVRRKLSPVLGSFAKLSYSRRVPSLQDRFYVDPFFHGNPDLLAEKDYTFILGADAVMGDLEASVEGFAQLRQDASANVGDTLASVDQAHVRALTGRVGYRPLANWVLSERLTLTDSQVAEGGVEFPYLPSLLSVTSLGYDAKSWQANVSTRLSGSVAADLTGTRLPGYGYVDLEAGFRPLSLLEFTGRIENLFNRPIELVKDYPLPGRVYSIAATGRF